MRPGTPFQWIVNPSLEIIDQAEMTLLRFIYGKGAKYGRWARVESNTAEFITRLRRMGFTADEEILKFAGWAGMAEKGIEILKQKLESAHGMRS
jgi:hypothetical protein